MINPLERAESSDSAFFRLRKFSEKGLPSDFGCVTGVMVLK